VIASLSRGHERYLGEGESIVLEVRRHPAALARPLLEALGVVAAALVIGSLLSPHSGDDLIDTVLGWVAVVFAARFAWSSVAWFIDRVVVTDQRMFEVSGIVTRKVASMPLAKLTDITYRRTLAGRLLHYGDLVVETPGQEQALTHIDYLPNPDDFYQKLTSLVMIRFPDYGPQPDGPLPSDDDDTGPLPRVRLP
jgi:hypothetical protein